MSAVDSVVERPRLRGWLHLAAFVVSLGGLVWLVTSAATPRAEAAAWIYGSTAVLVYLTSSTYHVFARSERARRVFKRADHAMIFLLIAGTFTPVCVLAVDWPWRWALLALAWVVAAVGIVLKVFALERYRVLGHVLYFVLGIGGGLVLLPALVDHPAALALIVAGGLLYAVGGVLFFLKKPTLAPRWFSYHEVWHAVGVIAGALLFAVNLGFIRTG